VDGDPSLLLARERSGHEDDDPGTHDDPALSLGLATYVVPRDTERGELRAADDAELTLGEREQSVDDGERARTTGHGVTLAATRRKAQCRASGPGDDAPCHRRSKRALYDAVLPPMTSQTAGGRFSYGVESTTLVRVETLAAARISASRVSRAAGLATRALIT